MLPALCRLTLGIAFALIAAQGSGVAQEGSISPQEHARRANEFLKANQPAKAIPELEALVAAAPDNVDAQANLGVLLYFQARYSDAVEHLRKAIQLDPSLPKNPGVTRIMRIPDGATRYCALGHGCVFR